MKENLLSVFCTACSGLLLCVVSVAYIRHAVVGGTTVERRHSKRLFRRPVQILPCTANGIYIYCLPGPFRR